MEQIEKNFRELLQAALKLEHADMGNIQAYRPETDDLEIVAQVGFKKDFLDYFKTVKAFDASSCGRALGIGNIVTIDDVETDIGFYPYRKIARSAGYRSVKSVPVLSRERNLGVLSVHFREPRHEWQPNYELEALLPELAETLKKYALKKLELKQ